MTESGTDSSQQDFQDLKKTLLKGMSALFVRQVLVKVIFFADHRRYNQMRSEFSMERMTIP